MESAVAKAQSELQSQSSLPVNLIDNERNENDNETMTESVMEEVILDESAHSDERNEVRVPLMRRQQSTPIQPPPQQPQPPPVPLTHSPTANHRLARNCEGGHIGGLRHSTSIENQHQWCHNGDGDNQTSGYASRGKRFWESSRRSLAKIISSATGVGGGGVQSSGSGTIGQASRAASNTDIIALEECNCVEGRGQFERHSSDTSRVSSCELNDNSTKAAVTGGTIPINNPSSVQTLAVQQKHHQQQHQQPTRSHSDHLNNQQAGGGFVHNFNHLSNNKANKGKARAHSCQHELARFASTNALALATSSQIARRARFNGSTRCILNVGGTRHEVLWSTLLKIPKTRLWRLAYTACFLLPSVSLTEDLTKKIDLTATSASTAQKQATTTSGLSRSHHQIPAAGLEGGGGGGGGGSNSLLQQSIMGAVAKRRFTFSARAASVAGVGQAPPTAAAASELKPAASVTMTGSNRNKQVGGSKRQLGGDCGSSTATTTNSNNNNIYDRNQTQNQSSLMVHKSILQYCDDFNLTNNEFYFDRQPRSFNCVLDYYRTGKLHLADELCVMSFKDDLDYWEIEDYNLDSCCQQRYHQRRDNVFEEMKKEMESLKEHDEEMFGTSKLQRYQKFVWDLLEKPQTSVAARVS